MRPTYTQNASDIGWNGLAGQASVSLNEERRALDVIFDRVNCLHGSLHSVNQRLFALSDRLQGSQPISGEQSGAEPVPSGLLGELDSLLRRFEATARSSHEAIDLLERI